MIQHKSVVHSPADLQRRWTTKCRHLRVWKKKRSNQTTYFREIRMGKAWGGKGEENLSSSTNFLYFPNSQAELILPFFWQHILLLVSVVKRAEIKWAQNVLEFQRIRAVSNAITVLCSSIWATMLHVTRINHNFFKRLVQNVIITFEEGVW